MARQVKGTIQEEHRFIYIEFEGEPTECQGAIDTILSLMRRKSISAVTCLEIDRQPCGLDGKPLKKQPQEPEPKPYAGLSVTEAAQLVLAERRTCGEDTLAALILEGGALTGTSTTKATIIRALRAGIAKSSKDFIRSSDGVYSVAIRGPAAKGNGDSDTDE